MSVKLSTTSLMGPLWAGTSPTTKPNGMLLEICHENPAQSAFTCLAFSPYDSTRFVFGDTNGTVYHTLMKKNKFVVAARLATGTRVTALAFLAPSIVMAASASQLHVIDLDHGRVEQRMMRTPHTTQITKILVMPQRRNFAATVSSDCVTLWKTAPLEVSHHTAELGFGDVVMRFNNFVSAALGTMNASSTPEAVAGTANNHDETDRQHGETPQTEAMLVTIETQSFLTLWAADEFKPRKRIDIAPFNPTAMAVCDAFIVVGTKEGKLLCFTAALDAISALDLPGGSPIVDISLIGGQIVACYTQSGHVWYVATRDYSVLFSVSYPSIQRPKGLAIPDPTYSAVVTQTHIYLHHLPSAKSYYERTFASTSGQGSKKEGSADSQLLYPFTRVNGDGAEQHSGSEEGSGSSSSSAFSTALPRQILRVDDAHVKEWIKVNLVAGASNNSYGSSVSVSQPQTLLIVDAIKGMTDADVKSSYRYGGASNVRSGTGSSVRGASSGAGSSRTSKVNSQPTTATTTSRLSAHTAASAAKDKKNQQNGAKGGLSGKDEATIVSLRGFLDHDSRVVNMDKLRAMLLRYGTFPERYRPLIWRFLLQLPEKRFTESQFVNLTARGPHPAVKSLMAPYPLPETKLRNTMFNTLSVLAWHSPVFSALHFTPNLVFPFVKLYSSDVQSSVEVLMAFLINWGQEFFTYYPHPPVSVVSFIAHTLKTLCPELHEHLAAHGVGTDVYVWDVMASLYTELLTRNEWLQVMDHAFANEPIWLFLFHVCLLAHLKTPLMELNDHSQIVAVLRRATPVNMPIVLQNTYQLQRKYVQSDLSKPYRTFNVFQREVYPPIMECNEAVITTKVRELEKLQAHEAQVLNMRDRIANIKKQLVQAAMLEDAFVGKQKAMVAAQFEATNDVWVQQVQLEKERQRLRDIEHETRLGALQEQLRSAHRIEAMQREIHAAASSTRDAEIDRQREVMKWDFADRMANQEMDRLEAGARMKLASVIQSAEALSDGAKAQQAAYLNRAGGGAYSQQYHQNGDGPAAEDQYAGVNNSQHLRKLSQTYGVKQQQYGDAMVPPPHPDDYYAHRRAAEEAAAAEGTHAVDASAFHHPDDQVVADESTIYQQQEPSEAAAHNHHQQSTNQSSGGVDLSSSATTSTPQTSSCASDPIGYYRNLQENIRRTVESNQQQQQHAFANLNSRYARALLHDDDEDVDTEVTEPICDDVGVIDENANNNLSPSKGLYKDYSRHGHHGHHHGQQQYGGGSASLPPRTKTVTTTTTTTTTQQHHHRPYNHYSSTADEAAESIAAAIAKANRYEQSVGGASETTQSSSMTRALLKPQPKGYYRN